MRYFWACLWGCFWTRLAFGSVDYIKQMALSMWVSLICLLEGWHRTTEWRSLTSWRSPSTLCCLGLGHSIGCCSPEFSPLTFLSLQPVDGVQWTSHEPGLPNKCYFLCLECMYVFKALPHLVHPESSEWTLNPYNAFLPTHASQNPKSLSKSCQYVTRNLPDWKWLHS